MLEILLGVFTLTNIFWIIVGSFSGAVIGALPGLTATMGVALFIPITFTLEPGTSLVLLAAVYSSASFGGNITAILIRTPGTPDSIFMTLDGYPMVQQGKASKALAITTIGAFIGGIISSFGLLFIAPPLSILALKFGPIQIFLTTLLGISIILGLNKENMLKGSISALLGFLISTVGMDSMTGQSRYTGGILGIYDGFNVIPVVIGMFAFAQILNLVQENKPFAEYGGEIGKIRLSLKEFKENLPIALKSGIIGTIVGIIPAAGSMVACGMSLNEAKRVDKEPETFGKGNPRGLMAVSAANNAVVGGSLVPLLTLSIPGNGTSAIFLGGLLVHGLKPGADLFTNNAQIAYTLLFGMFVCQIGILLIGLFFSKYCVAVTRTPIAILAAVIFVFTVVGSYGTRNSMFDVFVMLGFGIVGYLFEKVNISLAPFILAFILGPIAEVQLRRGLILLSSNSASVLLDPITFVLLAANIFSLLNPYIPEIKAKLKRTRSN